MTPVSTVEDTRPTSPAAGPVPESQYVEADGVTYHYHDVGEGAPTIFLHGGGPGCTGWSDFGPVAPYFSQDRRCVIVDILQYGKSEKCLISGPMWDFHAAKTVALMDALGIEKADFICNSWGGTIALAELVSRHRGNPHMGMITGSDAVHQGVALTIPPYEYAAVEDLLRLAADRFEPPLLVALDGITDPRNLGAIIRSVSAFSGNAVIVPERRSVGVTASAWKTSAGAAARVPVAKAANLNRTLEELKAMGYFVVGLDGGGDVELPGLELATEPLVNVVGSEGKGLSRLVTENCDQVVSIPIDSTMESLNASMAVGITLYEVSRRRAGS